jgi:hypothetical protein
MMVEIAFARIILHPRIDHENFGILNIRACGFASKNNGVSQGREQNAYG